jgi:hypothetical protein
MTLTIDMFVYICMNKGMSSSVTTVNYYVLIKKALDSIFRGSGAVAYIVILQGAVDTRHSVKCITGNIRKL